MRIRRWGLALFATVFVRLLGILAVIPVILTLMFLGVPASGGALSVYMGPTIYRFLHDVLPMPAAVESVRSILYFGGDTVGGHLITFAIWGAVSILVVMLIDWNRARRGIPGVWETAGPGADGPDVGGPGAGDTERVPALV